MASLRTSINNAGSWTQIGTGPAIVQVISPEANNVSVMVACEASQPSTNSDGIVMGTHCPIYRFGAAQPIWAQVVQTGLTALMVAQPDVVGGG